MARADSSAIDHVPRLGILQVSAQAVEFFALPHPRAFESREFALTPGKTIHHSAKRVPAKLSQALAQLLLVIETIYSCGHVPRLSALRASYPRPTKDSRSYRWPCRAGGSPYQLAVHRRDLRDSEAGS